MFVVVFVHNIRATQARQQSGAIIVPGHILATELRNRCTSVMDIHTRAQNCIVQTLRIYIDSMIKVHHACPKALGPGPMQHQHIEVHISKDKSKQICQVRPCTCINTQAQNCIAQSADVHTYLHTYIHIYIPTRNSNASRLPTSLFGSVMMGKMLH